MDFKDLTVYKKAFQLGMEIFEISKKFPKDPKLFISKISDSDSENAETQVWLDFAFSCKYINQTEFDDFINKSLEIGRMLSHMIEHPEKYGVKE